MIKKILFTLTFVLTCAAIMAVPAKRGQWKTITLADGSQVRAELRGDEHMRAWFTADGRCYQLIDNDGCENTQSEGKGPKGQQFEAPCPKAGIRCAWQVYR